MPTKHRYILQAAYLAERCRPDLDKRIEGALRRKPLEAFAPYVLEDRRWLVFDFKGDLSLAYAALVALRKLPFLARAEIMETFDDETYAMENAWAWEREVELRAKPWKSREDT